MAITTVRQVLSNPLLPLGIGVGLTRDTSTLMVAQYFKRKREFVEILVVAASGIGITLMSSFISRATRYENKTSLAST